VRRGLAVLAGMGIRHHVAATANPVITGRARCPATPGYDHDMDDDADDDVDDGVGAPDFYACHFFDSDALIPLTDLVYIGGDVMVVDGEVNFIG
jgi:hypothetical protein